MTGARLTDDQLTTGLARRTPAAAPAGLRDRILAEVEATRQVRPIPPPLDRLADADPIARRRALLLVAAALLALGLATAGVVGAFLLDRRESIPDLSVVPPSDVSIARPQDLPSFVRSTYDRMPELEPMTITFRDGADKGRILVDASGAIRIERFASPDDPGPETYTILSGTSKGELVMVDGRPRWYAQDEAIGEDPRVFVYATLGAARSAPSPGCETAVSDGEEYVGEPGRAWVYVGLETVAGRPTHHVRCGDDLWIDDATRVTLRSRNAERTIEATEVVLGQPPAHLFEIRPPPGIDSIEPEAYACAQDPYCSASPKPVVTPPPARAGTRPSDLDAVLRAAQAAVDDEPAYEVVVDQWSSKYPGSTTRTLHDGTGRYRQELTFEGETAPANTVLVGDDYEYVTDMTTDGVVFWRDLSSQPDRGRSLGYPLRLPSECDRGWQLVGVDLVHGRTADHLACPGDVAPDAYWIDRKTHLVLRVQTMHDEASGTDVQEVVALRLGPSPAESFDLPEGADVRE